MSYQHQHGSEEFGERKGSPDPDDKKKPQSKSMANKPNSAPVVGAKRGGNVKPNVIGVMKGMASGVRNGRTSMPDMQRAAQNRLKRK